jgi:serine protease AprX
LDDAGYSTRKDVTDAIQQVVYDSVAAVQAGELPAGNKVIVNCSIEVPADEFITGDDYEAFCDHFDQACTDLVVVAAAGNCGPQSASITAPGGGYRLLTIGATANRGSGILNVVAPFSSRGPALGNRVKPDVIAPGGFENPEGDTYEQVSVLSSRVSGCTLDRRTLRDKPWRHNPSDLEHYGLSGTSQAAALVSGVAALLVQHAVQKHGTTSHAFIADAIKTTARTLHYSQYEEGHGLVDADQAMKTL